MAPDPWVKTYYIILSRPLLSIKPNVESERLHDGSMKNERESNLGASRIEISILDAPSWANSFQWCGRDQTTESPKDLSGEAFSDDFAFVSLERNFRDAIVST